MTITKITSVPTPLSFEITNTQSYTVTIGSGGGSGGCITNTGGGAGGGSWSTTYQPLNVTYGTSGGGGYAGMYLFPTEEAFRNFVFKELINYISSYDFTSGTLKNGLIPNNFKIYRELKDDQGFYAGDRIFVKYDNMPFQRFKLRRDLNGTSMDLYGDPKMIRRFFHEL